MMARGEKEKGRGFEKKVKGKVAGGEDAAVAGAWKGAASSDHARMRTQFANTRSGSVVQYSRTDSAGMIKGCGTVWMAVVVTKRHLYFLASSSGITPAEDESVQKRKQPPPVTPVQTADVPAFAGFSAFGEDTGRGRREDASSHTVTPLLTPALLRPDGTPMEYRARRRNVTVAPAALGLDMVGPYVVRKKVKLANILGVVFSTSDEKSIVLDFARPTLDQWAYAIITFDQTKSRNEFVACLMATQPHCTAAGAMYTATCHEEFINVEYAKRTVSAVRLRRALDQTLRNKETLWIHVEDDYEGAGKYTHVVALLRSSGDTSIKVSTRAEWVKDRAEAEHKYPHLLVVTDTSMYLLLDEKDCFRVDLKIPIERIENATLCGEYFHFMMAKVKGTPRSVLVRVLGSPAARPEPVTSEAAVVRLKKHLETVYLDLKIGTMSLPLKLEKDFHVRTGFEKAIHRLSTYIENIAKWFQGRKGGNEGWPTNPRGQVTGGPDELTCYKWLLAIVRYNRMFDLIQTFTLINASRRNAGADMALNTKGRRLGLSLLGLCAHLELTHQLMYESILYEVYSCEAADRPGGRVHTGFSSLFVKDTFATQLISLYLNNRADQYTRLVLTEPMEAFLLQSTTRGERTLPQHATAFLKAFAKEEHINAIPHELGVVLATIQRSVTSITSAALISAPLDYQKCMFCFVLERLFAPAMQTPQALGITKVQPNTQQMRLMRSVIAFLKAGIGYSVASEGGAGRESTAGYFNSEECSRWKVENDALISNYLSRLAMRGTVCDIRLNDDSLEAGGAFDGPVSAASASDFLQSSLARRASLVHPTQNRSTNYDSGAEGITLQRVRQIPDSEVQRLIPSLASVHQYLGRDSERVFVFLMISIDELDANVKPLREKVARARARATAAAHRVARLGAFDDGAESGGSPKSLCSRGSHSQELWRRGLNKVRTAVGMRAVGRDLPSSFDAFKAFAGDEGDGEGDEEGLEPIPLQSPRRGRRIKLAPPLRDEPLPVMSPGSLSESPRAGSPASDDSDEMRWKHSGSESTSSSSSSSPLSSISPARTRSQSPASPVAHDPRTLASEPSCADAAEVSVMVAACAAVQCAEQHSVWALPRSTVEAEIARLEALLKARQKRIDATRVEVVAKRRRCVQVEKQYEQRRRNTTGTQGGDGARAAGNESMALSETVVLRRTESRSEESTSYARRCREFAGTQYLVACPDHIERPARPRSASPSPLRERLGHRPALSFPGIPGDVWRRMDDDLSSSSIGSEELGRVTRALNIPCDALLVPDEEVDEEEVEYGRYGGCAAAPPEARAAATPNSGSATAESLKYTVHCGGSDVKCLPESDDDLYGDWADKMYLPKDGMLRPVPTPPRLKGYTFPPSTPTRHVELH